MTMKENTPSDSTLAGETNPVENITEFSRIESDLAACNMQMEVLNTLIRRAIASQSLPEVVQAALDGVVSACSPDLALLYTVVDDWLVLQGGLPWETEHLNERKKIGQCLCGIAAEKKTPVFSDDIHCDERCTLAECKEAGIRSFAALPILYNQEITGVLGIASKTEKRYAAERDFLETLAATVGIVSHNAQLIEKIRSHSEDLERTVRERTLDLEEKNRELEYLNRLFVDREFRIKELREQVAALKGRQ